MSFLSAIAVLSLLLGGQPGSQLWSLGPIAVQVTPPDAGDCNIEEAPGGLFNVWLTRTQATPGDVVFTVVGTPAATIGSLMVTGSATGVTVLDVGGSGGATVRSVGSITSTGDGRVRLQDLRTTGTLGGIAGQGAGAPPDGRALSVDDVRHMSVGGDILGDLYIATGALDGATVGGSLLGDITIANGPMTSLTVQGEVRGRGMASGGRSQIRINGNLRSLVAAMIAADIDTLYLDPNAALFTNYLETTAGDFIGSLRTACIQRPSNTTPYDQWGLRVAGVLDADIDVTVCVFSPINAAALAAGRTLKVGAGLQGPYQLAPSEYRGAINLGIGGLHGQVILNYRMFVPEGSLTGAWSGRVTFGGTGVLIPPPFYWGMDEFLGGGAVGAAPFNLHGSDCSPQSTLTIRGGPKQIRLRSYGPVGTSGTRPLLIEFAPQGGTRFIDVTGLLTVVMHPDGNMRDILVISDRMRLDTARGTFRITPVRTGSERLRCLQVDEEPAVNSDWVYMLTCQ